VSNSLIFLLAVLLFGSAAQAADATSKDSYTYARTVLVNLPSVRPDRTYLLIIALPVSFNSEPARRYPVVSWPMAMGTSVLLMLRTVRSATTRPFRKR
jgi:hypothetical protein